MVNFLLICYNVDGDSWVHHDLVGTFEKLDNVKKWLAISNKTDPMNVYYEWVVDEDQEGFYNTEEYFDVFCLSNKKYGYGYYLVKKISND